MRSPRVIQIEGLFDLEAAGGVEVTSDRARYRARFLVDATGQQALLGRRQRALVPFPDLGRAAAFSLYATKNITSGEGGVLTANDEDFIERARMLSLHGMSRDAWRRYAATGGSWRYEVVERGFKYNLSDILAALAASQAARLEEINREHESLAALYSAGLADVPAVELLESFGEHIVPGLTSLYGAQIRPEWRALDVIEHTEAAIHVLVRRQNPGAAPPPLRASRIGPDEVRVSYTSARRLCAVARGICRGLGRLFGENLEIEEPSCMLRGDRTCEIVVRRV